MQIAVRNLFHSHHMNRQRVTARQVLDFLVNQKHGVVPVDGTGAGRSYQKGPFKAAYRNVQRWLVEFGGYDRGKRKGNLVASAPLPPDLLCE
jgi:very-short-patch-repair endonuclease